MSIDSPSADDFPLESVATFADLTKLMIRLYAYAGEPRPAAVSRPGAAGPPTVVLTRARLRRILDGAEPTVEDLLGWLDLCGSSADVERWRAAWRRASEHRLHERAGSRRPPRPEPAGSETADSRIRSARAQDPSGTADPLSVQAQELLLGSVELLRQAQQAVSDALVAWERAEPHEEAATSPTRAPAIARALMVGRAIRDVLDRAHRELQAIPAVTFGTDAPAAPAARTASDDDNSVLAQVSRIMQIVPPKIAPYFVSIMDPAKADSLAVMQPATLRELLISMPPVESAEWVMRWQMQTAARVLPGMRPEDVVRILEHVRPDWVGDLLQTVTHSDIQRAAAMLDALPLRSAARHLAGLNRELAARLLGTLGPETAADHLIEMDDQRLASPNEFTTHMTRQNATARMAAMDRKRAARRHSIELLSALEAQRSGQHPS